MTHNCITPCPSGNKECHGGFVRIYSDGESSFTCGLEKTENKDPLDSQVIDCHQTFYLLCFAHLDENPPSNPKQPKKP